MILNEFAADEVARQQPINISRNCSFIINLSELDSPDDLKADDIGVWQAIGSPSCLGILGEEMKIEILPRQTKVKDLDDCEKSSAFRSTRSYFRHSAYPDFHRIISIAKSKVLISYILEKLYSTL